MTYKKYGPTLQISGYGNLYSIDRIGNIYSTFSKKYIKQQVKKSGYIYVQLHNKGESKWYRLHRIVAERFIPNPRNLPFVNHIDGDKENNCVDNLEWVNGTENNKHAIKTGLVRFHYHIIRVTNSDGGSIECTGIDEAAKKAQTSRSTVSRLTRNGKPSTNGYKFEKIGQVRLKYDEV